MYGASGGAAGYNGAVVQGQQAQQAQQQQSQQQYLDEEKVYALILDLTLPSAREGALLELSKKREAYEGLAPILWHSFGDYLFCHDTTRSRRLLTTK